MKLSEALLRVNELDLAAAAACQQRWNNIAKPLDSLGMLEMAIIQIAGIIGNTEISLDKCGMIVMCADNGVVAEGVTQTGQEVTGTVAANMAKGKASVNIMARRIGCDVIPVDIGIASDIRHENLISHKLAYGTDNIAVGPAMSREMAAEAIEYGIDLVGDLKAQGYQILGTGEMGIGNTTTASAIAAVLLGKLPVEVTGFGAGLSHDGLIRKIQAIDRAIEVNKPDPNDPLDVLCKVGGLDIAGLAGVFLGGAIHRIPIIMDGFISSVAALLAVRLDPNVNFFCMSSHQSKEPGMALVMNAMTRGAPIAADMCLGEGTGAVAVLSLILLALDVYNHMETFGDIAIEPYQPLI